MAGESQFRRNGCILEKGNWVFFCEGTRSFSRLEPLQNADVLIQRVKNCYTPFWVFDPSSCSSLGYLLKTQTCLWRTRFGLSLFLSFNWIIVDSSCFTCCSEVAYCYRQVVTCEKSYTCVNSSCSRFTLHEMWKSKNCRQFCCFDSFYFLGAKIFLSTVHYWAYILINK